MESEGDRYVGLDWMCGVVRHSWGLPLRLRDSSPPSPQFCLPLKGNPRDEKVVSPMISSVVAGEGTIARAENTSVYIVTGLPRKTWLSAWFETRLSREDQGQKIDWGIFSQAILQEVDQLDLTSVSQGRTAVFMSSVFEGQENN